MQTKLTLRLNKKIIRQAKSYAREEGKSISKIVSDFFSMLHETLNKPSIEPRIKLTPIVKSLKGALHKSGIGIRDYKRHLEEKYL